MVKTIEKGMEQLKVVKRNGDVVDFDPNRISKAVAKAAIATGTALTTKALDKMVEEISIEVLDRFIDFYPNVENIQDIVEKHLMRNSFYEIAKEYILYRAKRQKVREETQRKNIEKGMLGKLTVETRDNRTVLFDIKTIRGAISRAAKDLPDVSVDLVSKEVVKNIYDGIPTAEIERALILSSVSFIERDPGYSVVAGRLFMQRIFKEVTGKSLTDDVMGLTYREAFVQGISKGVGENLFDKGLLDFDLERLSHALKLERDNLFEYMAIQTLYERYFVKSSGDVIELPQGFWMRVAMGLSMNEPNKNEAALKFYELISTMRFIPSTPTLFHAALAHPQLSSCYLTTVMDDLDHIFKCIGDNARLSKWSGGIGNDWTNIRATGALIKTTGVESQGVIPFLKIANDVTVAINRSGKRRGATCAYLETWHLDIEDFLDLRKNTGDERRRTHDMNTSNWIPDLFMKRVIADEPWTLFSPDEVSDLHDLYGKRFEKRYQEYESAAENGKLHKHKVVQAKKLWRKMLSRIFETGHPWITFKDPCNIRSPQDHAGVVHSSNLCTEITLNTSEDETAVCNLGSVNLAKHVKDGKLQEDMLAQTIKTAIQMLDNVIDINFYPVPEAKNSNLRHRPIGLGVMGFQDALYMMRIPFDSPTALEFSDRSMELISYNAIMASSELAKERGKYESYEGSKWDRGIFPIDTISLLEAERGMKIEITREESLDWSVVRDHVKNYGLRNSNIMAIAPTATISTLAGCFPCIEPIYKNLYVKANMSGEFTIVNKYLIADLKIRNLWNTEMLEKLKFNDGNLSQIAEIPLAIRQLYKEAFEISPDWCIHMAATRGKWIDQSQSLNIFMRGSSGSQLSNAYLLAWKLGLKTTYYLRTLAASQIEKSTLDAAKYGYTQKRETPVVELVPTEEKPLELAPLQSNSTSQVEQVDQVGKIDDNFILSSSSDGTQVQSACSILEPDCEACQ